MRCADAGRGASLRDHRGRRTAAIGGTTYHRATPQVREQRIRGLAPVMVCRCR